MEALRNSEVGPGSDLIMYNVSRAFFKGVQRCGLIAIDDLWPPVQPSKLVVRHLGGGNFAAENRDSQQLSPPGVVHNRRAAQDELAGDIPSRDFETGRLFGRDSIQVHRRALCAGTDRQEPAFPSLKSVRDPQ